MERKIIARMLTVTHFVARLVMIFALEPKL